MKHDARIRRLQKMLDKKLARLPELEASYGAATNPLSRASFNGKITRCKKDIESLGAKIERFSQY